MNEPQAQQDEAETQTQTQTLVDIQTEVVPNGDSTVGEAPPQSDTLATPVASVASSEAQNVKAEESKPSVSQTAEQSVPPGSESEGKDDAAATCTAPQADEPDLELIVSSITSPDEPAQDGEAKAPQSDVSSTVKEEHVQETNDVPEKPVAMDVEHLPEPPASPTSNTAFSGTSASTSNVNHDLPLKPLTSGTKVASANRVSIAYAAGTRRLLIDAEVVEKMTIFRAEGRIDIDVTVEKLGAEEGFKGISVHLAASFLSFSFFLFSLPFRLRRSMTARPMCLLQSFLKPQSLILLCHHFGNRRLALRHWLVSIWTRTARFRNPDG